MYACTNSPSSNLDSVSFHRFLSQPSTRSLSRSMTPCLLHILLSSTQMKVYTHTQAFLKEGHGRFSRDLRLDGGCPTYCLLPPHSPQTGRVRSLPFCSLPASSVLSVVTEWHVHSRLLPPAAAYSKAHTSPSSHRFNFCHFNFLFRVGFGRLCHAYALHKVDLLNNCSK